MWRDDGGIALLLSLARMRFSNKQYIKIIDQVFF